MYERCVWRVGICHLAEVCCAAIARVAIMCRSRSRMNPVGDGARLKQRMQLRDGLGTDVFSVSRNLFRPDNTTAGFLCSATNFRLICGYRDESRCVYETVSCRSLNAAQRCLKTPSERSNDDLRPLGLPISIVCLFFLPGPCPFTNYGPIGPGVTLCTPPARSRMAIQRRPLGLWTSV
jgi:hypothetical protein